MANKELVFKQPISDNKFFIKNKNEKLIDEANKSNAVFYPDGNLEGYKRSINIGFEIYSDGDNDYEIKLQGKLPESDEVFEIEPNNTSIDTLVNYIQSAAAQNQIDFKNPKWKQIKEFILDNNVFLSPYAAFDWTGKTQSFVLNSPKTSLTKEKLKKFDDKDLLIILVNALLDKSIINQSLAKTEGKTLAKPLNEVHFHNINKNILTKSSNDSFFFVNGSERFFNGKKLYINNDLGSSKKTFFIYDIFNNKKYDIDTRNHTFNMLSSITFLSAESDYLYQFSKNGRINSLASESIVSKYKKSFFNNFLGSIDYFGPKLGVFGFLKDQNLSNIIKEYSSTMQIPPQELEFKIMEAFTLLSLNNISNDKKIFLSLSIISDLILKNIKDASLASELFDTYDFEKKSFQELNISNFSAFKTALACINSESGLDEKVFADLNKKMSLKDSQNSLIAAAEKFKEAASSCFLTNLTAQVKKELISQINNERIRFEADTKPLLNLVSELSKLSPNLFVDEALNALFTSIEEPWSLTNENLMEKVCISKNKRIFFNSIKDFNKLYKGNKDDLSLETLNFSNEEQDMVTKVDNSSSLQSIKEVANDILAKTKFTTNFGYGKTSDKLIKVLLLMIAQMSLEDPNAFAKFKQSPSFKVFLEKAYHGKNLVDANESFARDLEANSGTLQTKWNIVSTPEYETNVSKLTFPESKEYEFVLLKTPLQQQIEGVLARNCMASSHQHTFSDVLLSIRDKVSKDSLVTIALESTTIFPNDLSTKTKPYNASSEYEFVDKQSFQTGNQAIDLKNMNPSLSSLLQQFYKQNYIENKYDIKSTKPTLSIEPIFLSQQNNPKIKETVVSIPNNENQLEQQLNNKINSKPKRTSRAIGGNE